ncbi:hypothetical protein TSAR_013087 [Trichomalopsis sarcophagae]|uniref:Uncharacterized protein n=1 Tax=Trichomalopsis sarcophagae TaxID=543379 RepID=A0A232FMU6_9HYME|nr:hypothetical protein TSAR_013087 [Trichomalopsis sarcophagae]
MIVAARSTLLLAILMHSGSSPTSRKKNVLILGLEPECIRIPGNNVDRAATIIVDEGKLKVAYVYREAGVPF